MPVPFEPVPVGTLALDCTSMKPFLVDRPRGDRSGKRVTQDGYSAAVLEILSNQPDWGSVAGITPEEIATLDLHNQRVAEIDAVLPAALKLVELLVDTRAELDDARHRQIFEIAAVVKARSKARRRDELLAKYEKTCEYRSASALKGARTRRRNAADTGATDSAPATRDPVPTIPDIDVNSAG